jgi:hypothetical protein
VVNAKLKEGSWDAGVLGLNMKILAGQLLKEGAQNAKDKAAADKGARGDEGAGSAVADRRRRSDEGADRGGTRRRGGEAARRRAEGAVRAVVVDDRPSTSSGRPFWG